MISLSVYTQGCNFKDFIQSCNKQLAELRSNATIVIATYVATTYNLLIIMQFNLEIHNQ